MVGNTDFAIDLIKASLTTWIRAHRTVKIKEIKFDIFGFSRVAAAARHFSNRVFKKDEFLSASLSQALGKVEYKQIQSFPTGKCRFIGLFDTVAAVGTLSDGFSPHDSKNGDVELNLPIGISEHVFQITAMHECRYNFSLNSVKPAYPEISLPGVHSDIGGGYNPQEEEFLFLNRPEFHTVPIEQESSKTKAYQNVVKSRIDLEKYPAIYPLTVNQDVNIQSWSDELVSKNDIGKKKRVGVAMTLKRTVSNELSNVALHVMLDAA